MNVSQTERLQSLEAGMCVLVGADRVVRVSDELAAQFETGDRLAVVAATGELLRIPRGESEIAAQAVGRAWDAFAGMAETTGEQVDAFFEAFAVGLEKDSIWGEIRAVNERDVVDAKARGRSTTRLVTDEKLRSGMIAGLRGWTDAPSMRDRVVERIEHDGFRVELIGAPLGVVGFVFEGRPNVLADACGVLRGGNTVVFRIGSDALRTAQAIMQLALDPALRTAGLPPGAATLVESPSHAAGWALFTDDRLALAVARGSGPAVRTLGSLAQSAGIPVSLHGTGGAWLVASGSAREESFRSAVVDSLDRKVCNTLNTCCIVQERVGDLVPALLESLEAAGKRRAQSYKLHVLGASREHVPGTLFERRVPVQRAAGVEMEAQAEVLSVRDLGREWEWEETPEITLVVVDSVDDAIGLFNRHSPQFVASLISDDLKEHRRFCDRVNAAFVGDGYTRWVDGQFALHRPELGLSNWQNGRLLGRGAVLSGDSVFTLRTRYVTEGTSVRSFTAASIGTEGW